MADSLALLALLIGLELVLGIDNVLVISIFVGRLPEALRQKARLMGLALAMVARIAMLFVLLQLSAMTNPVVLQFSVRDLLLLSGGLFLLYKAVREIHHAVEGADDAGQELKSAAGGFAAVIAQIVLLDIVFSVDSVITAIGLTDKIWVIVVSVIISFAAILAYAQKIGNYILQHPAIKILALSFLITIGVTIFMEGLHKHVPKAYIYLPMGFALFVELLQMRYEHNHRKKINRMPQG
ncbi:MAG: TerC family protein [Desulfobacterales bacterium]|nr:TerC family protein [Desulfobacterales bacterium]